jgi:23S rRNA (pseudouridine1915-N3)-methyltransferase
MKIELWLVGKTEPYVQEAFDRFAKRIKHYIGFELVVFPESRKKGNSSPEQLKAAEAMDILAKLTDADHLVLLDEKGREFGSEDFAAWINKQMVSGKRKLVFLIGGAYGFDAAIYKRANETLSLSKMTFSHQVIRVLFIEQLYRGFTIINNEPYHHA